MNSSNDKYAEGRKRLNQIWAQFDSKWINPLRPTKPMLLEKKKKTTNPASNIANCLCCWRVESCFRFMQEKATMERTCAACAMEWSIQLEKGLRSKKPGAPVQAILQFGPRLEQWSREPESNMTVYRIFGLVPGEDRLFANTILLRLADAFRLGDKETRLAVVRIFLSEMKHRDKRKHKLYKGVKGLLSKARASNHLELLKRVKTVFDSCDSESRALALVLFGCWADFAKDDAQIRYLILSSLVSPHSWEVKASLFAAGCFCEISDDFACIALEMLINIGISSEISLPVKLSVARAFAKFRCSYTVATKAYKNGVELALNSSDEEFLVAMLFSLSKLAPISTLLISEQVSFLLSLLHQERTSRVQETSLKCLRFLFTKGLCQYPVNSDLSCKLIHILEEPAVSSAMQYEALQVLHKILLYVFPTSPNVDLQAFVKLLTFAENAIQYPVLRKSHLVIHILVELSCKIAARTDIENGVFCSSSLPSRVISLIKDQITLLVVPLLDACQIDSKLFQDLQSLLKNLLSIVGKHPYLGVLVVDNINLVINYIVTITTTGQEALSDHVAVNFNGGKHTAIISKFGCKIYRFLVVFLQNLYRDGAINDEVLSRVQILVELVCKCNLFDCYTDMMYCLLLHSGSLWRGLVHEADQTCDYYNLSIFPHSCFVQCKIDTLEFVHRIMTEAENWTAYRLGIVAACQGEWLLAAALFSKLAPMVKSNSCCSWLKALFQYAYSEGEVQLLILPKQGSNFKEFLENNKLPFTYGDYLEEKDPRNALSINNSHYCNKLAAAHRALCSSIGILETAVTYCQSFCFQRWFLSLRTRILENVVGIIKVLRQVPMNVDWNCTHLEAGSNVVLECLKSLQEISRITFQLQGLAEELDLIGASFLEMDCESSNIIAALALSCSLLAFTAGFVISLIDQNSHGIFTINNNSCNLLQVLTTQNFMGRLWHVDHEIRKNLSLLSNFMDHPENCNHLHPGYQTWSIGYMDNEFLNVCSYAVSGAACLLDEAKKEHNERTVSQITRNGLLLISNTLMKWIYIPFRIPKYFFKVRQIAGCELFVHSEGTRNGVNLSVLPGFHLSLDLCLQLKNVPPNLHVQLTKLYCVLCCRVSSQVPAPGGQTLDELPSGYEAWKDDEIIELNKKLFCHVSDCMMGKRRCGKRTGDDDKAVKTFVTFEPNQKGQGFSSCTLDVSKFPAGSYRIKWHSCLVDSQGSYWSLLPLNVGPVFTVQKSM